VISTKVFRMRELSVYYYRIPKYRQESLFTTKHNSDKTLRLKIQTALQ